MAFFFSVIHDKDLSAKKLSKNLNRINNWIYQWEFSFYGHPNKQT